MLKKIVFEGIDGVGKTTIINHLKIKNPLLRVYPEISSSPIEKILNHMLQKDRYFRLNAEFDTLNYESLLLLADIHYKHSQINSLFSNQTIILDRDIISVIVYQKCIANQMKNISNYEYIHQIMMIEENNLRNKCDLLILVECSIDICIERIIKRDQYSLSSNDIDILIDCQKVFKEVFDRYSGPKILINGSNSIDENVNMIGNLI